MKMDMDAKMMDVKVRTEDTDWGRVIYYNSMKYRFALYVYDDDPSVIYLSNVFVEPGYRHKGLGDILLDNALEEARGSGARQIVLRCLERSFVHDWYGRHSFEDLCADDGDVSYVWMTRML